MSCCKCPSLRFLLRDRYGRSDSGIGLLIPCHHHSSILSIARPIPPSCSSLLLHEPTDMVGIRSAFTELASRCHASRSSSLLEQLPRASPSSHGGSPSSSNERKDDLRRALDTAIGSLHVLVSLYGRREMRWIKEKFRLGEDEKVQLLLNRCSASASLVIGRHDAYILLTLTFCVSFSLFDF